MGDCRLSSCSPSVMVQGEVIVGNWHGRLQAQFLFTISYGTGRGHCRKLTWETAGSVLNYNWERSLYGTDMGDCRLSSCSPSVMVQGEVIVRN